jgi:HK97 family phage portal protein
VILKVSVLGNLFNRNADNTFDTEIISAGSTGQRIHLQETALETVVTYVTDRASLVILRTEEELLHHRWNVKPNPYQNAQEFKRRILRQMLIDGECLVVQEGSPNFYLHIADSYTEERTGLNDVFYNEITVGEEELGSKPASEVYAFKYKNEKVKKYIDQLDNNYVDLFNRLVEIQKLQSQLRIYPKFKTMGSKRKESQDKFMAFLKSFQEAVETKQVVIAPTQDDYDINENKSAFKGFNIDEISKMESIYLSNVCRIYGISPTLFNGELADIEQHRDDFIRFVHSVMQIMATEINSKYFKEGDKEYDDNQVRLILFFLEYNSALSASKDIEKAIGSGVYTINDILEMQGKDRVDDEHADRRFLTRNIGTIEEADLKGGENTERRTIKEDEEN